MILVTLGTQDKPFDRLVKAVEDEITKGNIKDEVIVQAGCTKYKSHKMRILSYIPIKEFGKLLDEADFLITHGGVASIIEGLKANKKVIAVPRKSEFGEHVNDHQEQIVESLGAQGYIIPLYDLDKFDEALEKIRTFKPKEFKGNNEVFIEKMTDEIENLLSNY